MPVSVQRVQKEAVHDFTCKKKRQIGKIIQLLSRMTAFAQGVRQAEWFLLARTLAELITGKVSYSKYCLASNCFV